MTDVRTIVTRLKADTGGYTTTMRRAASGTDKFDQSQQQAQRSSEKWKAVGMAAQIGGAALATGLLAAAKAASNQEQALGSLQAVFKDSGAQMEDNARKATDLGLSTTAYSTAAAKLGAQLGNLGVSQGDLAGTTTDLMGKSADLAAMFGGTTQEAVDALGAAMRGEADPAERYGLALNVTAVNAEMAATGATKAEAMMSLLNKQMAKSGAAGAAAREYDSVAASTARMQAEFENATADLGKALLPALSSAAQMAGGAVKAFNDLPAPLKTAVTWLAAFGAAALLAGPRVAGLANNVKDLVSGYQGMGSRGQAAMKVAAVGAAATVAIPIVQELAEQVRDLQFGSTTEDVSLLQEQLVQFGQTGTGQIGRFGGELDGFGAALQRSQSGWVAAGQSLSAMFGLWSSDVGSITDEIGQVDAALAQMAAGGRGDEAAAAFDQLVTQAAAAGMSVDDVRAALPKYGEAVEAARLKTENAASASQDDTEAKQQQEAAVKELTAAYEAYIQQVQDALGLSSARDALIGQEERLAAAVKKNGTALRGRTAAAAANREAMRGEASSIADLVQSTYDNVKAKKGETAAVRAANRVRQQQVQHLLDSAAAAGLDRDETRQLLRQLNLLKPIQTSVTVNGLSEANSMAGQLLSRLSQVPGVTAGRGFGGGLWGGRASGGYITGPGGPTDDKIPAMLSNGEYVLRASAVRRIGVNRLDQMNRYAQGGLVGGSVLAFAGGGRVVPSVGAVTRDAEKSLDKWRTKIKAARDAVKELRSQAKDFRTAIKTNVMGSLKLMDAFDFGNATRAADALASATDSVAAAEENYRRALMDRNTASPSERAAADRAAADAAEALATARREQADAEKAAAAAAPTPANILKSIQDQAKLAQNYSRKMQGLMGRGLSMDLIKQLAGTDPAQAQDMLDALGAMSAKQLAAVTRAEAQKQRAADQIAGAITDAEYAKPTAKAQARVRKLARKKPESVKDALLDRAAVTQQQRLSDARERNGKSLDANTKRGRANRAALKDEVRLSWTAAQRTYDRVKATKGSEAAMVAANRVLREQKANLILSADAAGFNAKEVRGLTTDLGLVPAKSATEFQGPGLAGMRLDVDELGTLIKDVPTTKETEFATRGTQAAKNDAADVKSKYDTIPDSKNTTLSATRGDLETPVGNALTYLDNNYGNRRKDASLGGETSGLGADTNSALAFLNDRYGSKWVRATLGGDTSGLGSESARALAYLTEQYGSRWVRANLGGESSGLGSVASKALEFLIDKYGTKWVRTNLGGESKSLGGAAINALAYLTDRYGKKWVKANLGAKADDNSASGAGAKLVAGAQTYANKHPVVIRGMGGEIGVGGRATGGYIRGPGTGTSDSIPAMLSNGEYVIRASSVARYGLDMMDAINSGRVGNITSAAGSPMASAARVNVTIAASPVPIVIKLDNRTVATGQLKLQRQSGGTLTVGG